MEEQSHFGWVNNTKEEVQERRAVLIYIPTEEQPADMGTKPPAAKALFKHMKCIGLESTRINNNNSDTSSWGSMLNRIILWQDKSKLDLMKLISN